MKTILKKNAKGIQFIKVVPKPTEDITNGLRLKVSASTHDTKTTLPYVLHNINKGQQIYDLSDFQGHVLKHEIVKQV